MQLKSLPSLVLVYHERSRFVVTGTEALHGVLFGGSFWEHSGDQGSGHT